MAKQILIVDDEPNVVMPIQFLMEQQGYRVMMAEGGEDALELISELADMGGIAIDNARMYDRLKAEHEKLIDETHRWFEYGR